MTPSPLPQTVRTGILHLGLGAFHRAHQAVYTQEAMAASGGDWGIEAVSMRNADLAAQLNAQGGRYTLIERRPEGPHLQEITAIRRAHALPGNAEAVAARIADPAIHIVTLTVTEKGYGADIGARALDRDNPQIAHDLAAPGEPPRSVVGLLCHGLARRRAAGLAGMTVMSCDNLPENGHLLRATTLEFAGSTDPALARWIEAECAFPCAMVDRITPRATEETVALAGGDGAAVETEPFRQWVIEDSFAGPRPDWAAAGAQIVPDVAPFEAMKLRMLNGAHSLIAYLGALAGLPAVRDVMADESLRRAARRHMRLAGETLEPAESLDPEAYADALITRFSNPAIDHRCIQIAMDGSQKLPQRIFAPVRAQLAAGRDIDSFALALAAWIKFAEGRDEQRDTLEFNDPLAEPIRVALAAAGPSPAARVAAIAGLRGLAHDDALDDARLRDATAAMLTVLDAGGARAAAASSAAGYVFGPAV